MTPEISVEDPALQAAQPRIYGEQLVELPDDLYIPPDALEVFLEAFEGPLDLLLYLIRKQNIDILDIPVAEITRQYMLYLELMQALQLELAAEYLVMASVLAEIKSRMLLPQPAGEEDSEEDPRAELMRRLQEYECFKRAAEDLDQLPRWQRDLFPALAGIELEAAERLHPDVDLSALCQAMAAVLRRADLFEHHQIQGEALSVRERMADVLVRLQGAGFVAFPSLFDPQEGRAGVVVTFMAVLELCKESLIEVVQNEPFAPLHVRVRAD